MRKGRSARPPLTRRAPQRRGCSTSATPSRPSTTARLGSSPHPRPAAARTGSPSPPRVAAALTRRAADAPQSALAGPLRRDPFTGLVFCRPDGPPATASDRPGPLPPKRQGSRPAPHHPARPAAPRRHPLHHRGHPTHRGLQNPAALHPLHHREPLQPPHPASHPRRRGRHRHRTRPSRPDRRLPSALARLGLRPRRDHRRTDDTSTPQLPSSPPRPPVHSAPRHPQGVRATTMRPPRRTIRRRPCLSISGKNGLRPAKTLVGTTGFEPATPCPPAVKWQQGVRHKCRRPVPRHTDGVSKGVDVPRAARCAPQTFPPRRGDASASRSRRRSSCVAASFTRPTILTETWHTSPGSCGV